MESLLEFLGVQVQEAKVPPKELARPVCLRHGPLIWSLALVSRHPTYGALLCIVYIRGTQLGTQTRGPYFGSPNVGSGGGGAKGPWPRCGGLAWLSGSGAE